MASNLELECSKIYVEFNKLFQTAKILKWKIDMVINDGAIFVS